MQPVAGLQSRAKLTPHPANVAFMFLDLADTSWNSTDLIQFSHTAHHIEQLWEGRIRGKSRRLSSAGALYADTGFWPF